MCEIQWIKMHGETVKFDGNWSLALLISYFGTFLCCITINFFRARSQNCEKRLLASCLSVRTSASNNSASTGGIFMKFHIWVFLKNSRNFKFHQNLTIITGTLHEDQYTFLTISRSILLRMRNVSDKIRRLCKNTLFVFSNFFFPQKSCRLRYNVEKH